PYTEEWQPLLHNLSNKQKDVMVKLANGMTQTEIAREHGVSRESVRQLMNKAADTIRGKYTYEYLVGIM
ncbi:MAG: helix-turn-helix transcriptional regulator, partial [Peptostreptococcaceae bacterium]